MATSLRRAGWLVPSITLPPRIRMSSIAPRDLQPPHEWDVVTAAADTPAVPRRPPGRAQISGPTPDP